VINQVRENESLKRRIDELGIDVIDIPRVLTEIIETRPIIGIPIDHVSIDLREWAQTLKNEVKLWIVLKLVDLQDPSFVLYEIPDEYRRVLDTTEQGQPDRGSTTYDVSLSDLLESNFLTPGEELTMSYRPHGGERRLFVATLTPDGDLLVNGSKYSAPSYAALHCMQSVGSTRYTVNGWTTWRNQDGSTLADLRTRYLSGENVL
jgi:hypothetical protein